jgi:hypothetical protein
MYLCLASGSTGRYHKIYRPVYSSHIRLPAPDEQTPITPAPSGPPNAAAKAYDKLFGRSKPQGPTLRLGMGDTFAPNLLARTYRMTSGNPGKVGKEDWRLPDRDILVPKDRFYHNTDKESSTFHQWLCANAKDGPGEDPSGNTAMDYDNVAQFFIANKYNAMVPGKHDFYFGPERLRDLARLLADNNVHMLGPTWRFRRPKRQMRSTYIRVFPIAMPA